MTSGEFIPVQASLKRLLTEGTMTGVSESDSWIVSSRTLGLTQNDIASFVGWSQSLISLGF